MKIQNALIVLDKDSFQTGDKVTGKLVVTTQDPHFGKHGKAFFKFYDKLDIEWTEDEMVSVGITKRSYNNFKKPFQLNLEVFKDNKDVIAIEDDANDDYKFEYSFEFQLPETLQGSIIFRNAKNQYFIKAYLTNDESIARHYQQGVNVFDEFFKTLNHTYAKKEVIVLNKISFLPPLSDKHVVEAKSPHYKVTVTLPRIQFARDENIHIHLTIEHAPPPQEDNKPKLNSSLEVHKVGFKLFQVVKLTSLYPRERSRLFENLLSHSSRKHLKSPNGQPLILEEFILVPNNIQSSSSRSLLKKESNQNQSRAELNPIRVNYKLCFEIWKNFLVDELDINVPILIDPEI